MGTPRRQPDARLAVQAADVVGLRDQELRILDRRSDWTRSDAKMTVNIEYQKYGEAASVITS